MDMKETPGDAEGQGLTCCSPWGHGEPDTTEQLNKVTPQGDARSSSPA